MTGITSSTAPEHIQDSASPNHPRVGPLRTHTQSLSAPESPLDLSQPARSRRIPRLRRALEHWSTRQGAAYAAPAFTVYHGLSHKLVYTLTVSQAHAVAPKHAPKTGRGPGRGRSHLDTWRTTAGLHAQYVHAHARHVHAHAQHVHASCTCTCTAQYQFNTTRTRRVHHVSLPCDLRLLSARTVASWRPRPAHTQELNRCARR